MLGEALMSNEILTDFFITHNDLSVEGGETLIKSLANKKQLKTLAMNSCKLSQRV